MTVWEWLQILKKTYGWPWTSERGKRGMITNAEMKRLLKQKAVLINRKPVQMHDSIGLPVYELVFFPKGKRRTTMGMSRTGLFWDIELNVSCFSFNLGVDDG